MAVHVIRSGAGEAIDIGGLGSDLRGTDDDRSDRSSCWCSWDVAMSGRNFYNAD